MANYQSKDGIFAKKFIWENVQNIDSLTFWKMLFNVTPLSKLALKILSAPCTSAATERSFSTFSWIHNKKRNRLTTERAGKLTYLSYNWKMKTNNIKSKSLKTLDVEQYESIPTEEHQESINNVMETEEVILSDDEFNSISESDNETETESEIPYADSDSCDEVISYSSHSDVECD